MNALLRANNLRGLLRARFDGHPECRPWALLSPLVNPVYYDAQGAHQIDPISAGQIGDLPSHDERAAGADAPWLNRIARLMAYQFPDAVQTQAMTMVWGQSNDLVAVVGVSGESPFSEAQQVVDDYAEALFRLDRTESLRQEVYALRFVMERWGRPLLVVGSEARIIAATDAGWNALYSVMGGRPVKKNPVYHLPAALAGKAAKEGETDLGEVTMTVAVLPDLVREIVAPLKVVTLAAKQVNSGKSLEERVAMLTPSQKAVYQLLIEGLRNKEIAAKLGISIRTVIHHITPLLQKLGYQDRLQVLAAVRAEKEKTVNQLPPEEPPGTTEKVEILKVAPLVEAPFVPDLPMPKKRNRITTQNRRSGRSE